MSKRLQSILFMLLILVTAVSVWLFFSGNPLGFIGFILAILLAVLTMSVRIMQETTNLPNVSARLNPDAKGVTVTNGGNARAVNIHVALVPLDVEFDVPPLDVDARYVFALPHMVSEAKAVVRYENEQGRKYMNTNRLSALEPTEEDLLQPLIPIFGRK
ncbi:MAG: hypothetical protein QMD46_00900 [Methanomicrobiales archaeon]|nr:hypothetical protein [Methanomicrobiales archaeon]MDI6875653.1 hypothetical protein [Methanomicrobiales archaeon]